MQVSKQAADRQQRDQTRRTDLRGPMGCGLRSPVHLKSGAFAERPLPRLVQYSQASGPTCLCTALCSPQALCASIIAQLP